MTRITDKLEELMELGRTKKDIAFLVISGLALIVSIFDLIPLPFDAAWIAIILCGIPIVAEAFIGLVTAFDITADVLVSLALIASVCIVEDFAAGEVAFIMQLGALLEDLTVAKARAGIEKLVHLTPQTARVIGGGSERIVPAEEVLVGDILRVLPGETIPVDGIIISGKTSVNQAVMTGESLPVDKAEGDEVSSGTANQFGVFEMKASKVGEDSSIQQMIRLVQSADAGKAKMVGLADHWATWIVVIALTAAALTWFVTGQIIRAVTILVVFCPCALVLATPTAIMAAIGNATSHGFLVREGDALERLASLSRVTFDKTGTLTYGVPQVTAVKSFLGHLSDEELYASCAAVNGAAAGFIALSDTVRAESPAMIKGLGSLGVTPVLLTGDHESAANAIARQLGVNDLKANCLPEDKLGYIRACQQKGERVCMIGDGVNDAPALKAADVGIAMGGVGSDIAVDAADIALVDDEVRELPHLIALSKRMMTTIKLNMTFSMTLNFIAIALAITGKLDPVIGALVHNAGSVLVITNSAFLLKWRKNNGCKDHRRRYRCAHIRIGTLLFHQGKKRRRIEKDIRRNEHHRRAALRGDHLPDPQVISLHTILL